MIKDLLSQHEGKTLEFKVNTRPVRKILHTVVAFANTAGGTLVIGVLDGTREIVGVEDSLGEEERIASIIADGIRPLMVPDVQIVPWRDRELIVIRIPHLVGPYHVAAEGVETGVYVRLGSTNRRAGPELIAAIRLQASNKYFDEEPCSEIDSEAVDFRVASEFFSRVSRKLTLSSRRSLGLMVRHAGREYPSRGAVLLFGKQRQALFPDATIRCARFKGKDAARFIDKTEIDEYLPQAIESTLAVFDDRIEITNPGMLPFGLTLESVLSGVSRLRNRVIGRVFRELGLIEQWGSGIGRMISVCGEAGIEQPRFEELGTSFRVTLFNTLISGGAPKEPRWKEQLRGYLAAHSEISTAKAANLWNISDRTARTRLRKLVETGLLMEIGTSPKDPQKVFVLRRTR